MSQQIEINIPELLRKGVILWIFFAILIVSGLITSVFKVPADSQGVILRFGKFEKTVGPGLRFKLPFGIDEHEIIVTEGVRTAQFGISRDILEKASFYPESGDIIKWDNEFYQIDNVDANQYFTGKNPETWPKGSKFGYSVSVLCDTHVTRQTPSNIRKMRFGNPKDNKSYKGF